MPHVEYKIQVGNIWAREEQTGLLWNIRQAWSKKDSAKCIFHSAFNSDPDDSPVWAGSLRKVCEMCMQVGGQMVGDGKMEEKRLSVHWKFPDSEAPGKVLLLPLPSSCLIGSSFFFISFSSIAVLYVNRFPGPLDNTVESWWVQWGPCLFSCPSQHWDLIEMAPSTP